MNPPHSSRHPDGVKGRTSGGDLPPVGSPPRSPELGRPGAPEPGGSSHPDPAVALIGHATDAAFLTVAALLAVVVTVLIVLVTS